MLTNCVFFDSDCLSSFLWVREEGILTKLYPGRLIIPSPVYHELSHPSIPQLKARIDSVIASGNAQCEDILIGTAEHGIYRGLTTSTDLSREIIGNGEAAVLALAKIHDGTVASNNTRDVNRYIKEFSLAHITTGDIIYEAFKVGLIDETTGNSIWANMLKRQQWLRFSSFSDFIAAKKR